jgi:hypothetical protein
VSQSLVPIQLSSAQLAQITMIVRRHGIEQRSWEMTADFVSRVLRELDRHPNLEREITINVLNITPPFVPSSRSAPGITVGQGALWAVRIALLAFGIYSVF